MGADSGISAVSSGFWISWEMVSTSSPRSIGDAVILESAAKNTAAAPNLTPLYEAPMCLCGSRCLHTREAGCSVLHASTLGEKTRFYPLLSSWARSRPGVGPSLSANVSSIGGDSIGEHLFSLRSGEVQKARDGNLNGSRLQS